MTSLMGGKVMRVNREREIPSPESGMEQSMRQESLENNQHRCVSSAAQSMETGKGS